MTTEEVEEEFARLRFEPYAPVVRQLFSVLRMVNRTRQSLGLESAPVEAMRTQRRVLTAFEQYPCTPTMGRRAPLPQCAASIQANRYTGQSELSDYQFRILGVHP